MVHTHFSESMLSSAIGSVAKHISRLSPEDACLFREKFCQEPTYYCNSWLYILRSTRDDWGDPGYKLVDEDVLIGMGYRNHTVYLVHPMGDQRFSTTLALCQTIRKKTPYSIMLKKLDQDLYAYLAANGLFQELHSPSSTNEVTSHHPEAAVFL